MKTLKTEITGKFPFVLQDFRFAVEGIKEAIAQICKSYGDKVILWGLEKNENNSISEGAAYINGEIYLGGGTLADEWYSDFTDVLISETYDANGLKEFPDRPENDRLKNTYLIRKIVFASRSSDNEIIGSKLESFTRLAGLTETIALTDAIGNDNLKLDFQNGLLKRKWYFVETSGLISGGLQGFILPNIGDYVDFPITYIKGTNGAENWLLTTDYTDITLSVTTGTEGSTTVRVTRVSNNIYYTTITLKENGNVLDYCGVAHNEQGLT